MLNVCVSATSTDGALTTTAYLRRLLGATSTADDTAQQDAVVAASRWAETYVGYPLLTQVYSETLAGYAAQELMVSRTPIRARLRLFDSTDTGEATEYCSTDYRIEDAEAGFLGRDAGFGWTAQSAAHLGRYVVPGSELRPWYFEYQAGYIYPETTSTSYGTSDTGRSLPEDIERAVALKAAEMYEGQEGIASKGIGDLSISYTSERIGAAGPAERLLAPYRRVR